MNKLFITNKLARHSKKFPITRGDGDLNPNLAIANSKLIQAAVLVPLVARKFGFTVLLTKRTETLAHHPGQISFPGGHAEAIDGSAKDTALRETYEEIGVDEGQICVLGQLDVYQTRTGFSVTPIVAIIHTPFKINANPQEVAEVFEVPLSFLMNSKNHKQHAQQFNGQDRNFYAMPYNNYFIWGATAGMIKNLYNILLVWP